MSFLTVLMLMLGLGFFGAVLLSFVGSIALESDKAKANRYLAGLRDRDTM